MKNGFFRGHGLGNDYVVVDLQQLSFKLTPKNIQLICDRNWGLGSDGILALVPSKRANFGLRIFNPDGSEAENPATGSGSSPAISMPPARRRKSISQLRPKAGLRPSSCTWIVTAMPVQ